MRATPEGLSTRSGPGILRIPAINAVIGAVEGPGSARASQAAIDALVPALESLAMIGGLEVRMMAIYAVERVGRDASDVATRAKAMGLLHAYLARGSWELRRDSGRRKPWPSSSAA